MIKSDTLEKLCTELAEAANRAPDWKRIVDRYKSHPNFNPNMPFDVPRYAKHFSEIYLDLCLEDMAIGHPEWNIDLKPFKDGAQTEKYRFHYDLAGKFFANSSINDTSAEYDKVIILNGLPVVFEVKIASWKKSKSHQIGDGRKRIGQGARNTLLPEAYNPKLDPARELFQCDVGYVVMIGKGEYESKLELSNEAAEFKQQNGMVVPFYTDRSSFRKEVKSVVLEYNLPLKKE